MPPLANYPCPYLAAEVEMSEERAWHIAVSHPDSYPAYRELIAETLADPDLVAQDATRADTLLIIRWYPDLLAGKYVLVAVACHPGRNWIITAFLLDEEKEQVIWRRS